jgi:hypothetical protein
MLFRHFLFLVHFQYIEDLGHDALERTMAFAKSVISSVEPNSRFLELCERRMQRQNRKDRGVVNLTKKFAANRCRLPLYFLADDQNSISAFRYSL